MKCINYAALIVTSFFSLHSMEMVPFLKKENKLTLIHHVVVKLLPELLPEKPQKLIASYFMKLSDDKTDILDILQQQIHVAAQYMGQHSDKIKTYKNIARGSAVGTCGGCMSGTTVITTYGIVDGCVWCWCNVSIPKITCNMIMCGLSSCGCIGCIAGSCCVATGCAKKVGCLR